MVRLCNIVTWTKFSCRRSFCGQQATPGAPVLGHIASDGARRDPNSHFQQQLGGDAFLAPSRVVITHFQDQFLEFGRDRRPPAEPRFPLPEQSKALPMPADECGRLDDSKSLSPRKESGKQYQGQLGSCPGPTRLDMALQIQS